VYDCLVRHDSRGGFLPDLAESWSVEDDARTWTFNLRTDVVYHDGSRLRAEDVVATLERVLDPGLEGEFGTQGLYHAYLSGTDAEAVDGHTARLVTAEPMADLLDLLVDLPVVPENALGEIALKPVGSGPYYLADSGDGWVEMRSFTQHWAGAPPLDRVLWKAQPDSGQRVAALLKDEADIVTDLSLEETRMIEGAEPATVMTRNSTMCVVLMCNARRGACADRRVRQALNYALDVPAIIGSVKGGAASPLNGPLTSQHFGYDPSTEPYPFDPHKARTLLSDAGHAEGLELVIDIPTTYPNEAPLLAQHVAEQYADIGLEITVKAFDDREAYAEMVRAKQIDDACCFDSSPHSTYRSLREKFHSGIAGPWWQGYHNKEVNTLLEQAWTTVDNARRQGLYRRACRIIRDGAAWIYLYSPTYFWGVGSRAKDLKVGIDGLVRLA
jgi:peptide/nickel transport system substrate-binding protein